MVRPSRLPGAAEGLEFYLVPDFGKMFAGGLSGFGDAVYAAMGQAFFTLSLGISALEVFGSRIGKAELAHGRGPAHLRPGHRRGHPSRGLIIFPACFAFAVAPDQGPSLVFVTPAQRVQPDAFGAAVGTLFFVFMSFAALSTIIAVFENLITFTMEKWDLDRKRAGPAPPCSSPC